MKKYISVEEMKEILKKHEKNIENYYNEEKMSYETYLSCMGLFGLLEKDVEKE